MLLMWGARTLTRPHHRTMSPAMIMMHLDTTLCPSAFFRCRRLWRWRKNWHMLWELFIKTFPIKLRLCWSHTRNINYVVDGGGLIHIMVIFVSSYLAVNWNSPQNHIYTRNTIQRDTDRHIASKRQIVICHPKSHNATLRCGNPIKLNTNVRLNVPTARSTGFCCHRAGEDLWSWQDDNES